MSKRQRVVVAPVGPYSQAAFLHALQESVAAPARERVTVRERSAAVVEAPASKPGRLLVQLIRAGWSLNGNYYPADVLKRDGPAAWPTGTQTFIDHATETEDAERPAGSIKDLAGVLTTTPYWDESRQALVAEVRLFEPWRAAITDMAEYIGMSIRAWVYGQPGEAEGRQGFVVTGIPEGRSVDFVTVPAAGGAIISVLESVRTGAREARNAGHWFEASIHSSFTELADRMFGEGYLTREERITLSGAVGDALSAFSARLEADAPHLYQRDPWQEPGDAAPQDTAEGGTQTTAPPAAAAIETVTGGAPPTAPNPSEEGPAMGTQTGAQPPGEAGTATTEARTSTNEAPVEARLALVEAERDRERQRAQVTAEQLAEAQQAARQAAAQAAEAVAEMRRLRANEAGRLTVDRMLSADESGVPGDMRGIIGPRVHEAIRNHVPLTDAGDVDQAALEAAVTAAIRSERVHAAALLEAQGVGRVAGLGAEGDPATQMTKEQFEGGLSSLFASIGMDESVARLAAKGR